MAIKWKWNGKTVELSNEEPSTYAGSQAAQLSPEERQLYGRSVSDAERMMGYDNELTPEEEQFFRPTREEATKASREQKREWRKQQDAFYKSMKEVDRGKRPEFDVAAGMQEMLDNGAVWEEEDGGLGSYIRGRGGQTRNDAMVAAHDAYVDYMHEVGNTQYDPKLGWYNPDYGAPVMTDFSGRLIIRNPDTGVWMPAYGTGSIGGR